MNVGVFVKIGKEINGSARKTIKQEFEKFNLNINYDKPNGNDKVGFLLHKQVEDIGAFVKNVYKVLQHVSSVYLVAPQKYLGKLIDHPRIHCIDSHVIDEPDTCASMLVNMAYHGRQP